MKIKDKFKGLGTIIKRTFKGWNDDDPFRQSAVIAYYAIFSLPALLVLIINVTGFFFEKDAVSGEITRQIEGVMGSDTAYQVGEIVEKASETKGGLIPSIIAIFTIIFGATGVFIQLQKTLDQIWDVKEKPNAGFMKMLKNRLFSFGLILSIGFLMLISLVMSSVLAAASHWLEGMLPDAVAYLFYALEFVISLSVISAMFVLMFKFLPDVKLRWRNLWVGGILTGLLFMLGKYGLSFYFGKSEPASVYGAAGSIVLVLLWVSYSSMIVFFGAEFTKQYAVYHGVKIEPKEGAEKLDSSLSDEEKRRISEKTTKGSEQHLEGAKVTDKAGAMQLAGIDVTEKEIGLPKNTTNKGSDMKAEDVKKQMDDNTEKNIHVEADLSQQANADKLHKFNGKKIKSRKELQEEIARLENRLVLDQEEIKDNFTFGSVVANILPRVLRVKPRKGSAAANMDDYLKAIARFHITPVRKEPTLMDKIKRLINMGGNNH